MGENEEYREELLCLMIDEREREQAVTKFLIGCR